MSLIFIFNTGIFIVFMCGVVAGWCFHHIWNDKDCGLKKCIALLAGVLALTFIPHPAHAQKTWKLVSPGPCEAGSGGGTAATSIPSCRLTAAVYNGNLGGMTGANAKCAAEFGEGFSIAGSFWSNGPVTYRQYGGTNNSSTEGWYVESGNNCQSFTSNSGTARTGNITYSGATSYVQSWSNPNCSTSQPILCCNF